MHKLMKISSISIRYKLRRIAKRLALIEPVCYVPSVEGLLFYTRLSETGQTGLRSRDNLLGKNSL